MSTIPQFVLFVAGMSKTNEQLRLRLLGDLKAEFGEGVSLEVVDIISDPEDAIENNVFVTPTLLRVSPSPEKRIIGKLSNADDVTAAMHGDEDNLVRSA